MAVVPCTLLGWGLAPWGTAPWGGGEQSTVGGPLPSYPPFNVYCVGPCGDMSAILSHLEVIVNEGVPYITNDPTTGDLVFDSPDGTALSLYIGDAPAFDWTFEFTVNAKQLPLNFLNRSTNYFFIGVADVTGSAAGIFLSQTGVAYAATFDASLQPLANSQSYFSENDYYIFRIAVSSTTGAVYLYITELTYYLKFGHQLRYVLPAIPYSATPQTQANGTSIFAEGTAAMPTQVFLDELCLGNGLNVPNLPPVAEAGPDQAVQLCQIVKLDGSGSFDPENAPLQYFWRLIGAPVGSMYCFTGNDGTTHPLSPPSGFTNKMYSTGFQGGGIPAVAGDVLLVAGDPYNIVSTGHDGTGYYVQIDGYDLPDDLTNVAYEVLKQNGINNPNSVTPTFMPDVAGFYTFDLMVFDGSLYSDPRSVTVVNVLVSPLPRGITPDVTFTWNYLSDFWNLIEDPGRIETVWGGLTQVAATELYTLWQIEYCKSVRDIQRTFIRRWLHYDLILREPFIQITASRFIFRGVDSAPIANAGVTLTGQHLDLTGTYLSGMTAAANGLLLTPPQIASQLQSALQTFDSRFMVTAVPVDSTHSLIRVYAPFSFSVAGTTTLSFFTAGDSNSDLSGTDGVVVGPNTYKTEISLLGLDVEVNDNLAVLVQPPNAEAYWLSVRISGVVDSASDTLRFQRIQTQDAIPAYATNQWQVPSKALSTQLDFWDGLVDNGDVAVYEVYDSELQTALYYQCPVIAATESQTNTVLVDVFGIADFFQLPSRFTPYFWGVYRRTYMPIEPVITDIPNLQRVINSPSESEVLHRNLDFFLDTFRGAPCIRFDPTIWVSDTPPVPRLWAEYTYLDNRPTIEANFGIPVDFTIADLQQLPSTVDYLSAVQGLWYAYINGPTVFDLRVGTQILLGLPFAEVTGIITLIRTDYSPNTGQILIQDADNSAIVRQYTFPVTLPLEINPATGKTYAVGDTVQQFAPLVTGAEILDWVKSPNWFQHYLSQGVFYEIQKYFKFLVKIQSAIFNLQALLFVKNFLINIKPTYTYPLFVVEEDLVDEVEVSDEVDLIGHLDLEAGAIYALKQTSGMDAPDPGPGRLVGGIPTPWTGSLSSNFRNALDTNTDADYPGNTFPTSPTADPIIVSGLDKPHLSPSQLLYGFCSETYAGGTPTPDGVIFRAGFPAYQGNQYALGGKYITDIPTAGIFYGDPAVATGTETLNCCEIFVEGIPESGGDGTYDVQIYKNGVLSQTLTFTYAAGPSGTALYTAYNATMAAISVVANDVLTAKLVAHAGANNRVLWNNFFITLGNGVALVGTLPAGTYTRLACM